MLPQMKRLYYPLEMAKVSWWSPMRMLPNVWRVPIMSLCPDPFHLRLYSIEIKIELLVVQSHVDFSASANPKTRQSMENRNNVI